MKYLVNFPTRVTQHSKTAIDNFIKNIETNKSSIHGVIRPTYISDHDGQLLKLTNNVDSDSKNLKRK